MVLRFLLILIAADALLYVALLPRIRKLLPTLLFISQALLFALLIYFIRSIMAAEQGYVLLSRVMAIVVTVYLTKLTFVVAKIPFFLALLIPALHRSRIFMRRLNAFAIVATSVVFLVALYGVTIGRADFYHRKHRVVISSLPSSFDSTTIVHLTDLHLGSLPDGYKGIGRLVREVNALQPDIIVFTGDMVNDKAEEMLPWVDTLLQLKARLGKFAVTGNHDHGDHANFTNEQERQENLTRFLDNMERMGFQMLNNSHLPLVAGADTLWICGVMNIGLPPFSVHGNLKAAVRGTGDGCKVLLSHNPSHFQQEVVRTDIPLTLSGHTHAMQMGLRFGSWQWSPVKYIYPLYDGLYEVDGRYLHVSRGQGYIFFAGRLGLRPDITTLVLRSNEDR